MKTNSLIISEEALLSVLREFSDEIKHNENEWLVSIFMKRKLEKDHQKSYCIAFEARADVNDKREYFTGSPEEFKEILGKSIKEDTPIDFGLVEGTVQKHTSTAFAFQVKRFIAKEKKDINQQLLKYINKVLAKYKPGDASLIIIPMINTEELVLLDIDYLIDNLEIPTESFGAIFILTPSSKSESPQLRTLWRRS